MRHFRFIFISIGIIVLIGVLFFKDSLSEYFSTWASIATIVIVPAAFIALLDWRRKIPSIQIRTFPFIIGSRDATKQTYIFYLYCVNRGDAVVHIFDFKCILNGKEQLERIISLDNPKFRTSKEDEISLDYDQKKFPMDKPLKYGEPLEGFVIFEGNIPKDEKNEKIEIIAEDSFRNIHRYLIPKEDFTLSQKTLELLQERSKVKFPQSVLPPN